MSELMSQIAALSPERRELLGRLVRAEGVGLPDVVPACSGDEDIPLSFAQEQLWFLDQLEPGDPSYNIAATVHFRGGLDVTVLEQALRTLVARHESLRTTFVAHDGRPVQRVAATLTPCIPFVDMRASTEGDVRDWIVAEARRPFDLEQGPLLRLGLLRLGEDEHELLLVFHHIVVDGWSMRV